MIQLATCELRPFVLADAEALARHADNRNVWINLRDRFPHPYTPDDARKFIEYAQRADREVALAISVKGEAVGAIGIILHEDVERLSGEIGYWLSESYWGRGIATEALRGMTDYAIQTYGLTRVYAKTFEWNPASCRVLEKAGYAFEGRLRKSAIKDGQVIDELMYAFVV